MSHMKLSDGTVLSMPEKIHQGNTLPKFSFYGAECATCVSFGSSAPHGFL